MRNNYDHVGGSYALVEVTPRMEMSCLSKNFFLEFVVVSVDCRFDEHYRRGTTTPDDNAFRDNSGTHCSGVIFDRFGIATKAVLRFNPVIIAPSRYPPSR